MTSLPIAQTRRHSRTRRGPNAVTGIRPDTLLGEKLVIVRADETADEKDELVTCTSRVVSLGEPSEIIVALASLGAVPRPQMAALEARPARMALVHIRRDIQRRTPRLDSSGQYADRPIDRRIPMTGMRLLVRNSGAGTRLSVILLELTEAARDAVATSSRSDVISRPFGSTPADRLLTRPRMTSSRRQLLLLRPIPVDASEISQ